MAAATEHTGNCNDTLWQLLKHAGTPATEYHGSHKNIGSFGVKSPKITENLNPTDSDFNETGYTCCLGTHSTKSKILGQSDQSCGRYGPPNFESFGKNGRG